MTEPLHVAFLWHQHQPFYKNLLSGDYLLPWVRLHAIKDYIGMLLVLHEYPDLRATINLVPSLVMQIEEYAAGTAEDASLRITRKPADALDEADRRYMMELFFAGNPDRLIRPFPRYAELFDRRERCRNRPDELARSFSTDDLRDAQVWATLAWFHPLAVEADPALKALREKGRGFTENDKAVMLRSQDAVIRQVIPLHRKMAETGQIELTTTPFYHPILPLLCNMESARMATPDVPMPDHRSDFRPDADLQIARAVAWHERTFGRRPTGMWPSEGSVSEDIIPLLKPHGIQWIASDESVLARSIEVNLRREGGGTLEAPDDLCQPYRLPGAPDAPVIIFRDHALSDLIGFGYHHGDSTAGAEDLVNRLHRIRERCTERPRLLAIMLDGENPWDYYDQAGVPFLRALYERLAREKHLVTTRISDYVQRHPPARQLPRLHAGSWIDGTFNIWFGHADDRKAWSLVAQARETVRSKVGDPSACESHAARTAWEEILIAEGSDWAWWFGADHHSEQDDIFDALFRLHLANAYTLVGEPVPDALHQPIARMFRAEPWTPPAGALRITLDGAATSPEEWAAAGRCSAGYGAAAMHRAGETVIREAYFGFGDGRFHLRLDGRMPSDSPEGESYSLAVHVRHPAHRRLLSGDLAPGPNVLRIQDEPGAELARLDGIAVGTIIEIACPLEALAALPDNRIEFFVEILRKGSPVQRIPQDGLISLPTTLGA